MYNIQVIGISEGEKRRDGENICSNNGQEFSKTNDMNIRIMGFSSTTQERRE